jgi:hypothetical protein
VLACVSNAIFDCTDLYKLESDYLSLCCLVLLLSLFLSFGHSMPLFVFFRFQAKEKNASKNGCASPIIAVVPENFFFPLNLLMQR